MTRQTLSIKYLSEIESGILKISHQDKEKPEPFGKFNLIYGFNGSGKTTLAKVIDLYSGDETNDPSKELSGSKKVELMFTPDVNGKTALSPSGFRGRNKPKILVFRREAIITEITSGMDKQNSGLEIYLHANKADFEKLKQYEKLHGEQTKLKQSKKEKELEKSKKEKTLETNYKRRATNDTKTNGNSIKQLLKTLFPPVGSVYDNYKVKRYGDQVTEYIGEKNKKANKAVVVWELKTELQDTITKAKQGNDKEPINELSLSIIAAKKERDLTKKVKISLATEKKAKVSVEEIKKVFDNPVLADWLHTGIVLHGNEPGECKFCGKEFTAARLKELLAHFDEEYNKFQAELDDLVTEVKNTQSEISTLKSSLPDKDKFYSNFQSRRTDGLKISLETLFNYYSVLVTALEDKKNRTHEGVELTEEYKDQATLTSNAEALQQLIKEHNIYNNKFDTNRRNAFELLEKHYVATFVEKDAIEAKLVEIDQLKQEIGVAEDQLDKVATGIEKQINDLELAKNKLAIKPAKKETVAAINRDLKLILGHQELVIAIKPNGTEPEKFIVTRDGRPAERISEGEASAIAFVYFINSLEDKEVKLSESIVVIDDPASSLDVTSFCLIVEYMKIKVKKVGQLFILTHNFTFLGEIKSWFKLLKKHKEIDSLGYYMLEAASETETAENRTAKLKPMDKFLIDFDNELLYLFSRVYKSSQSKGTYESNYHMPNLARRFCEVVYKQGCLFDHEGVNKRLKGKLVGAEGAQDVPDFEKNQIDKYTNKFSHTEQANDELEELRSTKIIMGYIINLLGKVDPKLYIRLCKKIGVDPIKVEASE